MAIPEILSPCSCPDTVKAAVYGGADAIYIGLKKFNARMFAKNFDNDSLVQTVEFCHKNGVRVYVTMNTLILDKEMQEAINQAVFLYNSGVDALIIADLGFAKLLKEYIPDFEIHASTQLSCDNSFCAEYLSKLGFKRMVASRELSAKSLRKTVKSSNLEIEMFVHGAICASHSGQCLLSSFIGGRSGNRGQCAQPCRLPYNGKYPISFRDMCLANHITEILDFSPASLKIEGRMKNSAYVYTVTSIYKKLVTEHRNANSGEIKKLTSAFSRSGFTDGYFTNRKNQDMLGVRTKSDIESTKKTEFSLPKTNKYLKEPIFLNRERIESVTLEKYKSENNQKVFRTARFYDPENIPDTDYFDITYLPLEKYVPEKANGVFLPPFVSETELDIVSKIKEVVNSGAKHILLTNIGQIEMLKDIDAVLHIDYRLNITNSFSASLFSDFSDFILSPELNMSQMRDICGNKSAIVYGRVPVMLLEKNVGYNKLTDRKHIDFPIIKEFGRDVVLNSVPFYMADKLKELTKHNIVNHHYIFTVESKKAVLKIIRQYINGDFADYPIKRIK